MPIWKLSYTKCSLTWAMNQPGWCLLPSRLCGQSTLSQSFGEIIKLIFTEPIWEDVFLPILFSSSGPIWPAENWGIFCSLSGLSQYSNQGLWLVRRVKPWLHGLTSLQCSSSSTCLCWGRPPSRDLELYFLLNILYFYFVFLIFFYVIELYLDSKYITVVLDSSVLLQVFQVSVL